jgi:acyl transferase domain-containing protein/NADP-dependent 3-hydroxy acid dehydrogenase YdfG/acyl carrier protein
MSDFLDRISKLSPKRLALLAVELQEKVDALEARAHEPLAIVGMACRFPGGANDPAAYWELLAAGRDAIGPVPPDRWDAGEWYDPDPDAPGRMSVVNGGFLGRVDGFDAAFFGISPREALTMDPQQRLLLQVCWEALEHAGLAPERLAGSATGVFVGVCNSDHFQRVLGRGVDQVDTYLASGNAHSVVAGRISYTLGLNGPAFAVDTACSSSLVALHLGCQSLRRGESRVALVGGVNVMCSPVTTVALTKGHMLAPDGRCKTFDAAADGFSRGEGCGALVLKRLADAVADGDRILALVRGTAINQDGRSGGLTVPSGPAQEAVIRAALADAGVGPADVSYVEAHGTGTTLGDPIEVKALAGALGPGHSKADPLLVGSVKTNIGHLESAAGVAGVMKVVLSLLHERLPPHLHFRTPNPHIAWADLPVAVEAAGRPWPRSAQPRRAGVSSFGFSGTNAHVVLEEAPAPSSDARAEQDRPLHVLPLSARTGGALGASASRWAAALAAPGTDLADAAHVAGAGRSHFGERLAVVAADAAGAREALAAFAAGAPHPALRRGSSAPGQPPEVAFLFTGQGAQYPEMGALLYRTSPPFREVIDRCDAALGPDAAGRTLTSVLFAPPEPEPLVHRTEWSHPANFAVEVALAALWRSWGVEPAAVIGHSLGEYAAACVAGVFTVEEGIRFAAERGRLVAALPPGGSMAAIFAPVEEVARAAAPFGERLSLAAINAADSVVVSGEAAVVEALLADFARREVQGHRLFVAWAAHSPLVAPALDGLEAVARTIPMRAPRIPVAWNLTGGQPLPGGAPDAGYWRRHMREPVRFADGLAALHRDGHRIFLEVGPHPVLVALAQRSLPEQGTVLLGSLRRGKDDWQELLASLAELYVRGVAVDWAGVDRPYPRRRPALPTYPFEEKRFWIEAGARGRRAPAPRAAAAGTGALLGERLDTALPAFERTLTPDAAPWLAEHRLQGSILLAGPVFMELAQAAAREALGPAPRAVAGFEIHQPLVVPEDGRTVQVQLGAPADGDGEVPFTVHGRPATGEGGWLLHASGRLAAGAGAAPAAAADAPPLDEVARALAPVDVEAHYRRLADLGIDLGAPFRSIREARRRDGEALATIALDPALVGDAVAFAHPCLLDGALQAIGLAMPDAGDRGDVFLFTSLERVELRGPLPQRLRCHARLGEGTDGQGAELRADVTLRGDDGAVLGVVRGACLRRASRSALARAAGAVPTAFYEVRWEPAPAAAAPAHPPLPGPGALAGALGDRFETLAASSGLAAYDRLLPELDRLSAAHVARALRELGFDATPGRRLDPAAEADRLGVAPRHRRLLARLLAILAEDGVLRRDGEAFTVAAPLPALDPEAEAEAVRARVGAGPELATLGRCGPALARALRGEQDPLHLLFPEGHPDALRELYFDSPSARTFNGALADALAAAVAALPAGARLRVLEVGAGTGGTTSFLLPRLPADRVEYTFTDVSPVFVERAAETFAGHPGLRRALLDVERDPVGQGLEAGAYDVVIAANVLHATADLRVAVEHARRLLAPGGLLFLLEGTAPERWVDLTFGLTEGWWRFTDTALRPAYPLVPRERWTALLGELGFTGAAAIPGGAWASRRGGQQALVVARAPAARRRVTLIGAGAEGGVAAALAERLQRRGDEVALAPAEAPDADLAAADDLVYLGALGLADVGPDDPAGPVRSRALAAELPLRWLARVALGEVAARAWLVTRGAQPAAGALSPGGPWQAPLWGAGRVFALEQPARWGGLVDLDPAAGADAAAAADALLASLDARDGEDQTAWRAGARVAARLVPAAPPPRTEARLRADATYLVTGGFGGLGVLVARWLAERGARHVALLGRHPQPGSEAVRAIEALGARVHALGGDVGDEAALAAALRHLAAEAPPLRGVVHAAADLGAARLEELTPAAVQAMLRPKLDGTVLLERLTRGMGLDFLALFSSTTALLGAAGFAHYAAANVFLDTFAHAASARGRRVLSVNWGTWEAMRLASAERQRSYREAGLEPMPAAEALDALARLLAGAAPQAAVARVDWSVLRPLHEARRARPFLSRLATEEPGVRRDGARVADAPPPLPARLATCAPDLRGEVVLDAVRGEVAAVLGVGDAGAVAPDAGLFEMGMDSLMSVELKRRLERAAGRSLPSTLTFNYPNARALARFLERELSPAVEAAAPAPAPAPPAPPATVPAAPAGGDDLGALSDAELEARLRARLERNR